MKRAACTAPSSNIAPALDVPSVENFYTLGEKHIVSTWFIRRTMIGRLDRLLWIESRLQQKNRLEPDKKTANDFLEIAAAGRTLKNNE